MNWKITPKDFFILAIAVFGAGIFSAIAAYLFPAISPLPGIMAALAILLFFMLEIYRRLEHWLDINFESMRKTGENDYRQQEALISLVSVIKPDYPLPPMRDWAASPDILRKIVDEVLQNRPDLVVETGSGVSTLLIAHCLKRIGAGQVISLDHDASFASATRKLLKQHAVDGFGEIIYAPLKMTTGEQGGTRWYDPDALKEIKRPIDLLIIDGPPCGEDELARYPALPMLYDRLKPGATVILDDASRAGEKQISRMWRDKFPGLTCEFVPFEKGAMIFRKSV